MTFQQNIARFVIGDVSLRSLPGIALEALERESDTPSLRILAGLSGNENEFLIDQYFRDALIELSITIPTTRQAAIIVGLAIADEVFEGKRNVFEGTREMKWKALDTYAFHEETKHYYYDSIGFEKVYGLFDKLDDLKNAGTNPWQNDRTNRELEDELTSDLLAELKAWSDRMKSSN